MQLNASIIAAGCGATILRSSQWVQPLQAACSMGEINTPLRVAAFLATCGVESARLTMLAESLNYSAAGLLATFPSHFTPEEATQYARQPPAIANRVYANRNGNGDEASGDGWRFKGRGCIQISGRQNYLTTGIGLDLDLITNPELIEQDANAALSAAWYWTLNKLNPLADAGNFLGVSRAVNLGSPNSTAMPNGYSERLALYTAGKAALGI